MRRKGEREMIKICIIAPYLNYSEMEIAHNKLGKLLFGKSDIYRIFNPDKRRKRNEKEK